MAPGNSGTSKTRELVCELLAIRLLKEYSTRELVCFLLLLSVTPVLTTVRSVRSYPPVGIHDSTDIEGIQMPCRTIFSHCKDSHLMATQI